MKNIKEIIIAVAVLFIVYLVYDKFTAKPELVEVPIRIEVPVPAIQGEIKPEIIEKPIYVEVENPVNIKLLKEYNEAKDSIVKLNLYKNAITNRTYSQKFEDSIQQVTVNSKVQGKLLEQDISYFIKPRSLIVDRTVEVPIENKLKVFGGVELGLPISQDEVTPIVKGSFYIKGKKDNLVILGIDTQKTIWTGFAFKF